MPPTQVMAARVTSRWTERAAWVVAFALCVGAVDATQYKVHDADSRLYVALAAESAARPLRQWAAPQWNGHWHRQGYFYEHPPGLFIAVAAMDRLGLGPFAAAYTINFVAIFFGLWLLWQLGCHLDGPRLGATAVVMWALCPIFLQYLVRANQEDPLAAAMLLALYGLVVPKRSWARALLWGTGLAAGLLIKGAAGLSIVGVGGLYWLLASRRASHALEMAAGSLLPIAAVVGLEAWHRAATGTGLWSHYAAAQLAVAAHPAGLGGWLLGLVYYFVRPWWYLFPWSVLLAYGCWRWWRRREVLFRAPVWRLGLAALVMFIVAFSIGQRRAGRYLFPVYPLLALAAAWLAWHLPAETIRRLTAWRDAVAKHAAALPYALMALLVVGTVLKIYFGTYHYSFIRWWTPHTP